MFLRAREECQLRRIPVAGHEAFQIVAIPRLLLDTQYMLDGILRRIPPAVTCGGPHHRSQAA